MEKRTYPSSRLRLEKHADGSPVITGHAAVFNTIASGGWFREQVAPGAFSDSLKTDDIRALWNHDTNIVLGRNKAGTLDLWEDEKGLAVQIEPSDTGLVRDLLKSIERGDVSQMSFGFQVQRATWTEEEDQDDLRTIEQVKLWEVSPVTFPFYKNTDVSLKAEHRAWRENIAPARTPLFKSVIKRRLLDSTINREF